MGHKHNHTPKLVISTLLGICMSLLIHCNAQEDSLRSALRAMSLRQKELGGNDNMYYYNDDGENDVPLLRDYIDRHGEVRYPRKDLQEKINYDYVDLPELEKRMSSTFRERMAEEDRQNKMEQMARALVSNWDNNEVPENYEEEYLRELYHNNNEGDQYPFNYPREKTNKRAYYPTYSIENIGLRKRGRYDESDDDPFYNYSPRTPRGGEDNEFPLDYSRNRYYRRNGNNNYHQHGQKRFLVTKRSSNFLKSSDQRRSVEKQTDPRVEKELSNIFSGATKPNLKENKITPVKPILSIPATTKLPPVDFKKNIANVPPNFNKTRTMQQQSSLNKEVFSPVAPIHERPTKTEKKKSIDWSDYFGIDRRKKSDTGLDKDWLLERYHKAMAITAKKRNADLPLKYFRNRDESTDKSNNDFPSDDKSLYLPQDRPNEDKLNEFSSNLRNMEEKIIDDALKYTGAHQGETDSTELQKVKDNIINNLAAAYNFEKMRNALEEYKNSIESEKAKLKQEGKSIEEYIYEEKRVSVPRKEAIDESREQADADNRIKCTENGDCHEQNYKTPVDVLENHISNIDQCPAIQRACNDFASDVRHYGHVFEGACNIYQMCLLCSSNSWFSPTRHCNALFLDKAYEMCLGKEECQKEAQRSIHYMLDINKSIQAQSGIDECEVICTDNAPYGSK